MIAKAELALYRERMCALVEMHDQDKTAELALSGGVDSMTVLFAMLETGRKPTCFTFYLQDTPSEDLLSSQAVCKRFGLKHRAVEIPWDIRKLAHDVRHLILRAEVLKKTIIQCMHPWLYLYPAMESDLALCGLGGDDLLCTQRKVQVLLNMKGEQALRESGYRKCYSSDLNFSAANIIRLGEEYGKRLIDVYDDRELEAWFSPSAAFVWAMEIAVRATPPSAIASVPDRWTRITAPSAPTRLAT